jgi:Rrf2 family protein
VKLSTRSRYGTRLILDLARKYNKHPVHLAGVAQRQNISIKYLEQIVRPLQDAGYLISIRGPKGGHLLAKDPKDITVGEIVTLLEGSDELIQCAGDPNQCNRASTCASRFVWQEAARAMYDRLNEITFSNLLDLSDEMCNGDAIVQTANPSTTTKPLDGGH